MTAEHSYQFTSAAPPYDVPYGNRYSRLPGREQKNNPCKRSPVPTFSESKKSNEVTIVYNSKNKTTSEKSETKAIEDITRQIQKRNRELNNQNVDHWEIESKGLTSENYWERYLINKEINFGVGYTATIIGSFDEILENKGLIGKISRTAKIPVFSTLGAAGTVGYSIYQYSQGEISELELGLDITVSLISVLVPGGFMVGVLYFSVKSANDMFGDKSTSEVLKNWQHKLIE